MIPWTASLKAYHGQSLGGVEYAAVVKMARTAVNGQVAPLRKCGFEVDHKETDFIVLLRTYFRERVGKDLRQITRSEMLRHRSRWAAYHEQHARLQVIPVDEHRALTRKRAVATPPVPP